MTFLHRGSLLDATPGHWAADPRLFLTFGCPESMLSFLFT